MVKAREVTVRSETTGVSGKENTLEIPSDHTTSPIMYKFFFSDNLEMAFDHIKVDQEEQP